MCIFFFSFHPMNSSQHPTAAMIVASGSSRRETWIAHRSASDRVRFSPLGFVPFSTIVELDAQTSILDNCISTRCLYIQGVSGSKRLSHYSARTAAYPISPRASRHDGSVTQILPLYSAFVRFLFTYRLLILYSYFFFYSTFFYQCHTSVPFFFYTYLDWSFENIDSTSLL